MKKYLLAAMSVSAEIPLLNTVFDYFDGDKNL